MRIGKWNKSRNHFLVLLTAADIYIYMDGSKHEMIPYQPSMFVQQGSCDKHPVVFQPRKQQEFLAVLD